MMMAVKTGHVTGNTHTQLIIVHILLGYIYIYLIVLYRFSTARLVHSLIMVHALEEINQERELGNLTLGYLILDSCGDVTTALIQTQAFMMRNSEFSRG